MRIEMRGDIQPKKQGASSFCEHSQKLKLSIYGLVFKVRVYCQRQDSSLEYFTDKHIPEDFHLFAYC